MPTQELDGSTWTLYRHKNDHRVHYWAQHIVTWPEGDREGHEEKHEMQIRATRNALHPKWDEVPLEFTVDGGTMDYRRFIDLYERVGE